MSQFEFDREIVEKLEEERQKASQELAEVAEQKKRKNYIASVYFMGGIVGSVESAFYIFFPEYQNVSPGLFTTLPAIISAGFLWRSRVKINQVMGLEHKQSNLKVFSQRLGVLRNSVKSELPAVKIDDSYLLHKGFIGHLKSLEADDS